MSTATTLLDWALAQPIKNHSEKLLLIYLSKTFGAAPFDFKQTRPEMTEFLDTTDRTVRRLMQGLVASQLVSISKEGHKIQMTSLPAPAFSQPKPLSGPLSSEQEARAGVTLNYSAEKGLGGGAT